MRRFLTLVCMLGLAIPAGVSISGCYRNPAAKYCPTTSGYGQQVGQVDAIVLQPQTAGISLAYGQTTQAQAPSATDCIGNAVSISSKSFSWGTSNNQLVDISPSGAICAGTWNRNTGGGIADYTFCNVPSPLPNTGGLPYAAAYITASADSVTSNPVAVFIHPQVSSISLVVPPPPGTSLPAAGQTAPANACYSQGEVAQLDAQACFTGANNKQLLFCAPSSTNSSNAACPMPPITPDIIASGTLTSITPIGGVVSGNYVSGGTISGTAGQSCALTTFNNGAVGTTATVSLTGSDTIAGGTPLVFGAAGSGATAAPTSAVLTNGTATCSGTVVITSSLGTIAGTPGQTCSLTSFNNGSQGATATVTLTAANMIASGTPLSIGNGGLNATAPPTTAQLSNGSAVCSGIANVQTTMTPVPSCESSIGTMSFAVGTSSVATINSTNNQITAEQPGTTVITASLAGSGSSAGFFSTCPPASISVSLANGSTSGTVTQGVPQNLTTTVLDTNGKTITGLNLTYQSTNPIDIQAAGGGSITTSFPGVASVNALCQPNICNPAPSNQIGFNGTGLPLTSNAVTLTTPGTASDYAWFGAPGVSQYFAPFDLQTGTPGSTVLLPYVPNSMVMDRGANSIYFGSARELMTYSTASNSLASQSAVPGVVLAVAPDNSHVLINDQARHLFYIYSPSGGGTVSFPGMGNAAQWTPDAQTLYITDNADLNTPVNQGGTSACSADETITGHTNALYVYNVNTGWNTYTLPPSTLPASTLPNSTTCQAPNTALPQPVPVQTPAVLIPSVGAYLRGDSTVARTWCPSGTVGNQATITYYPVGDTQNVQSDVLATTLDGGHVLGAEANGGGSITLNDIAVTILPGLTTNGIPTPAACTVTTDSTGVQTMAPLNLKSSNTSTAVNVSATSVNQVVTGATPTSNSVGTAQNLAFITYSGNTANASLPYYLPATGSVSYVPLTGAANITAPIAGAFSADNTLFFTSTAGDNLIHVISIPTSITSSSVPTDQQQVNPKLPACTPVSAGGVDAGCTYPTTTVPSPTTYVPATVITVKPKTTT